ncbi:hypothetical protein A4A49_12822 [Nicotiana attenuata]|uniref:Secreted protein n=1 Tax=Nicotiana attenuata TaxID=49451 RepID=A0A1J6IU44_NICAT|nr:hypothetical protein A4A49_12822 [Nicotiana attenuata]
MTSVRLVMIALWPTSLQLQIGGRLATLQEHAQLNEGFPLNAHAQHVVRIADRQRVPADEKINTPEHLVHGEEEQQEEEADEGDDVIWELMLMIGRRPTEPSSSSSSRTNVIIY